jgi:general secretion pathway protein J
MDPGNETDPAPLSASPNTLVMLTALPDPAAPGSDRRVQATLMVAGRRLVLRWQPYLHAERRKPAPPAIETELLPNVNRMEPSFWRAGGGWVETWRSPDLPALVRIRLVSSDPDRRHWPDIVAAPLLDRP